ncbi:MAG: archaellin/type IV pilin N-terminal domain-containing protein [Nanoarchaeota archaeon]
MENKKAVSTVVATVLIILITVAAVTFLWVAVNSLVQDKITKSVNCNEVSPDLMILEEKGWTCYDGVTHNTSIQVSRGAGDYELKRIELVFSEKGSTVNVSKQTDIPLRNSEKTYNLNSTMWGINNADSVKITPVLQVGNQEQFCDPTKEVAIRPCSS